MRYSRAPYEKVKEDLAMALRGEGIQPPAPSAIPIAEYYHVADAEIEGLLARHKEEQEKYRIIFEHQAQAHRHMKHQTDGEMAFEDDAQKGRRSTTSANGINHNASFLPPLFDPRKLNPKEEQAEQLKRSMDRFLPSLLVPTAEQPSSSSSPSSAKAKGDASPRGSPDSPSFHPTTSSSAASQARLRHRSAKEQQLALLSQMIDPTTGERVRLVENPYRRQREELAEQERRRHLQPHTAALLRPLGFEEASEAREPYKVLLETQAMLAGRGVGVGPEGTAFDRKGWRHESMLSGDPSALLLGPEELAEHLHFTNNNANTTGRVGSAGANSSVSRIHALRALGATAKTPGPTTGGGGVGNKLDFSTHSDNGTVMEDLRRLRQEQKAVQKQQLEALRADKARRAGIRNWRNNKEEHLHKQEQFAIDDRMTQRQHFTSLNERYKHIEAKMGEVQKRATAAEESRAQELVRQTESRYRSNALEALRSLDEAEFSARRRLEAEENIAVNKYILLPFEEKLARLQPSLPLLPDPAVGALPIDDTAADLVGGGRGGGATTEDTRVTLIEGDDDYDEEEAFSVFGNYSSAQSNDADEEGRGATQRHVKQRTAGGGGGGREGTTDTSTSPPRNGGGGEASAFHGASDNFSYFKNVSANHLRLPGVGANGRLALTTFVGDDVHSVEGSPLGKGSARGGGDATGAAGGGAPVEDDETFGAVPLIDNNHRRQLSAMSARQTSPPSQPQRIGTGFRNSISNAQRSSSARQPPLTSKIGEAQPNALDTSISPRGLIKPVLSMHTPRNGGGGKNGAPTNAHDGAYTTANTNNVKESIAAPSHTIAYATLAPIADDAPAAVKSWATAFFDAPTPMTTMRTIAVSLGLMENVAGQTDLGASAEGGGGVIVGGGGGSGVGTTPAIVAEVPFQRVASLYAPSSNNDRDTPRGGGGGMANRNHRRRERAKPFGFVGL